MEDKKIKDFRERKILGRGINNILADYYLNCRKKLKSLQVKNCASFLQFKVYDDKEQTKKLHRADFCKHPLCVMCAWRLSIKRTRELAEAVKILKEQNPDGRFYFLTLTVSNWDKISKVRLKKLQKQGVEFIRKVLGTTSYYVSLEIAIGKDGMYHPHLHALVYTTKYIDTTLNSIASYRKEWAKITKKRDMNYQILTVYPVARGKDGEKSLHEITKYILKPENRISPEMVVNVSKSIENVKKGFSSGEIRKSLREAKRGIYDQDIEEMERLEEFGWRMELYRWLGNSYVLQV